MLYFWENANPNNGLVKDRAFNSDRRDFTARPGQVAVVASIAATGYGLDAYAIGVHRGWLKRDEATARVRKTLRFLKDHGLKEHGWFYHFLDWDKNQRIWNTEASTIDTGLLVMGILMCQSTFEDPEIQSLSRSIVADIDWNWMRTDGGRKGSEFNICMGWHPENGDDKGGFIDGRWNQYWENPFLDILAVGASEDVPAETWTAFYRRLLTYKGRTFITGGPLFLHEMPYAFIDFKGKRDKLGFDYWISSRNAVLATRQYCIDNPKHFKGYGPDAWGLNACDIPDGYTACAAFGPGEDNGTLMPSSAVGAVNFCPKESIAAAAYFKKTYPKAWGRYGFANALNPTKDWIDPDVIGIDLGMVMLGIENYRDHLPHRLIAKSPIIQRGLQRAGIHDTAEGPIEDRFLQTLVIK